MKLIFFGSSQFSIPILKALSQSKHEIVLVVSTPAAKKGRGLKVSPSLVEDWCRSHRLSVITPESLKTPEILNELHKLDADCFVIASYGKMLPDELLEIPKKLPLNIHPSLLPKYRGAAPIARQILNAEKETGVTIAKVTSKLDAGDILAVVKTSLDESKNSLELETSLSQLGAKLILQTLDQIEQGNIKFTPQKESESTYASKLDKSLGQIDWNKSVNEIYNLVRATQPWPSAFTFLKEKRVKVLKASKVISKANGKPGQVLVINNEGIQVRAGEGVLRLETVHPEAGKEMSAYSFAQGARIQPGDCFS